MELLGDLGVVAFRSVVSFIFLFFITKFIGKKQVSELSLFDYVIGISIGNFAAEISINLETSIFSGLLAVSIFGAIAYFINFLTMKSIHLRRYFIGDPTIIIRQGKILYNHLKNVKCDVNDLLEQARISGYFDLSEIAYAVMEANGKISFLQKAEYRPASNKDMNNRVSPSSLCANIVIDGKVMEENLKQIHKDIDWLKHEVSIHGKRIEDMLLVTVDRDGKVCMYEKYNSETSHDFFE